jgi:5'-nucleotidase
MNNRRDFLKCTLGSAIALSIPGELLALPDTESLTILHTNDVHSQVEPFPDNHKKFPGMGGAAARAAIIHQIRQEEKNVLLLDAGDMFQGTPYFNLYKGELEIKLMSEMGYDAATMGNHDFDLGVEGFEKQLIHATFPIVNSNYDLSNTVLHGKTYPYTIIQKGKIKIGILGVGVCLKGLVFGNIHEQVIYRDPLQIATDIADKLKYEHHCHLIICLSHLGYSYTDNRVSDRVLGQLSRNIDIIIGGHTHTFLDQPQVVNNLDNEQVLINQVGWAGAYLGRIDIKFERNVKKKLLFHKPVVVDKKSIG